MAPSDLPLNPYGCRPAWATPRDPSCPTLGPAVGRIAARLGRPLLPWQQLAADIMGEVEDLDTGRLRYQVCDLIVPRRAGKTVLTLAQSIQRASRGRRRRAWYTSQTGTDAADVFVNEWLPLVDDGPLGRKVTKRLSNGSQRLRLRGLDSTVGVFPPTRLGLHGKDADYTTVDEYWAFAREKAAEIEAGVRPASATRPGRQLVRISAAGDASSTALLDVRDTGRALVDSGRSRAAGVFYMEYAPPHVLNAEGLYIVDPSVDLDDPALWARTHPAVGHTIDLDFLTAERATTKDPAEFYRPYLGLFSTGTALAGAIPGDLWRACKVDDAAVSGRVRIGYDVAVDGSWAAVAVASRQGDGRVVGELAVYDRGDAWLVDKLLSMRLTHRGTLHALRGGPADAVTAELVRRGVDVVELAGNEATTACAELLGDIRAGRIVHRGQPALDAAVDGAARAERGDGWVFTRKRSSVDIAPLVALTAATSAARSTGRSTGPLYRESAEAS